MFAHWPAIAVDKAGTVYVVWDTDARKAGTTGGCNGAETPTSNSIVLLVHEDLGKTWSKPLTVAHGSYRVFWPWIAAGDPGKVSVVWYRPAPASTRPRLPARGHLRNERDRRAVAACRSPPGTRGSSTRRRAPPTRPRGRCSSGSPAGPALIGTRSCG